MQVSSNGSRFALQLCLTLILGTWSMGGFVEGAVQGAQLSHFVNPTYPPLARQARLSGDVVLRLNVDATGSLSATLVPTKDAPHPGLVEAAMACVQQWRFKPSPETRQVSVTFHFAFSGTTRFSDFRTDVTMDFEDDGAIRVSVITDGVSQAF